MTLQTNEFKQQTPEFYNRADLSNVGHTSLCPRLSVCLSCDLICRTAPTSARVYGNQCIYFYFIMHRTRWHTLYDSFSFLFILALLFGNTFWSNMPLQRDFLGAPHPAQHTLERSRCPGIVTEPHQRVWHHYPPHSGSRLFIKRLQFCGAALIPRARHSGGPAPAAAPLLCSSSLGD